MRVSLAFLKKEWLEAIRGGKCIVIVCLFLLFGIMNPALAKLTPWMMDIMADSMAESGLIVTDVEVNALTSWTQFFKNIPMGLIVFVLISGSTFTREYGSGTLVLVLTKGLPRYQVVLAKSAMLLALWTFCYWLCFGVTYGYNAYFWDNGIVDHLTVSAVCWWLFGVWTICLMVLFSVLVRNSTGVLLGTGGTVLAFWLLGRFPDVKEYVPTRLMDAGAQVVGADAMDGYGMTALVTVLLCVICVTVSIPVMNRKQI